MSSRAARWLLGLVLPTTILCLGCVPFLAYRSDLPARVASHFNLSGVADDSMSVAGFAAVMGVMIGLGLLACIAIALAARRLPATVAAMFGFLGCFVAALGAGILAQTVASQRGLTHWRDASSPLWSILAVVGVALAIGMLGAWLGARVGAQAEAAPTVPATPAMNLAAGERAVWNTTLHNRWFYVLGALTIAGGCWMMTRVHWTFATTLLIAGLAVLSLSRLEVRADRHGLRVGYGYLPWPSSRFKIDEIVAASVVDVRPLEWGGWGYRGSLTLTKRAAVVYRAGPGLRLELRGGKAFAVTVDDPATPAALLNAVRTGPEVGAPSDGAAWPT